MAQISVIVPVYNVENYIERCVDSILKQTFEDYELILVDDGSVDSSRSICERYSEKDKRIKVLARDNGGAAAARNTGLDWVYKNSDSQWIAFIDSDDWIHSRYLELLFKAVIQHNVQISQCGVFDTDGKGEIPGLKECESYVISSEEANSMRGAVAPTRKLYDIECFKNIRYPEGRLFEDEFVTYKILFGAENIAYVNEQIYYYFIREGSLMHSNWNPRYLDALDAYKEQIDFFSEAGYINSEKRSVINMMNNIIVQFHNASKKKAYPQIKIMRKEMRKLVRKYGKFGYGWISFRNNQGAYEVLHPQMMWVYWVIKSKIGKTLGKGK